MYTLNELYEQLATIAECAPIDIKVTSIKQGQFNDMEGYQYYINVKATLLGCTQVFDDTKRKTKLFKIHTNSTYIEDFDHDTTNELKVSLMDWFNTAIAI